MVRDHEVVGSNPTAPNKWKLENTLTQTLSLDRERGKVGNGWWVWILTIEDRFGCGKLENTLTQTLSLDRERGKQATGGGYGYY
jgi:hypothetical protein